MKKFIFLAFVLTIFSAIACSTKTDYGQPNVNFKELEKDFIPWWTYHKKNILLSSNFVALDNVSNRIGKEDFLLKLTSGDYIPIKLIPKDSLTYYQLFRLDEGSNSEIRKQIKSSSTTDYVHFKMEGKNFPAFQFVDLNGVAYNNENSKGKIIVLKCWFITCHACVAEFAKLNQLVDNYRNRKDIVFIGLALDSEEKLTQFLAQKKFNYAVVADQQKFITTELNVSIYPTHILIDSNGIIRKVVNSADELIPALKGQNLPESSSTQIPPSSTSTE